MERQTIEINKSLIPYTFIITIGEEDFSLRVDYNNYGDFFTIELSKSGKTLCSGEPIVYGKRLFEGVRTPEFPAIDIVAIDLSQNYNVVTYPNFGDTVLLFLDNAEETLIGG